MLYQKPGMEILNTDDVILTSDGNYHNPDDPTNDNVTDLEGKTW